MQIITTILWFLLALTVLVAIHEFGHFYVARLCGVKVLRFSIGFGPRLLTWKDKQETEFAFSLIPLGGYVKMFGERDEDVAQHQRPYSFHHKTPWQRILIAFAGPAANFILAILLYAFIAMRGTVSYLPIIDKVEANSIADNAGLVKGQILVAIDGKKITSERDVALHLLGRLGEYSDITFTVKNALTEEPFEKTSSLNGWLRNADAPDPIEGLGITFFLPPIQKKVAGILADSPAQKAGLQVGDEFLSVDGLAVDTWEFWSDYVRARPEQKINMTVLREEARVDLVLIPAKIINDKGETLGQAGISGVREPYPKNLLTIHQHGFLGSFVEGVKETWKSSGFVLVSMKKLILGEISVKNLSGPIGIATVAGETARAGIWVFVNFLAVISVYLGVINLFPIPILDGGHIVYNVIEWVKGSPVSERVQIFAQQIGLALIFGLMSLAIYYDIIRLTK